MRSKILHLLILLMVCGPVLADEDDEKELFTGKISVEGGTYQVPGGTLTPYQYSHLDLESHVDIAPGLSLGLEAQANAQDAQVPMIPSEPEFERTKNLVHLEWENSEADDAGDIYSAELEQVSLRWTQGSLDLKAGLFKPDWGVTSFYRPTDYFYPQPPLVWLRDEPLTSEGLDASCFLFDDLSVEGAVRWLEGGTSEEVLRLVDKGIGISVTPSFAWMAGRNGFGLDASLRSAAAHGSVGGQPR